MARSGIYKSEVVRARDKLLAVGRMPTIDAIRMELGNTGSKTTIQRYVKEIEEEEGGATGTKVAVSEAIQDLVGRLAARLNDEADARSNEALAVSAATAARLQGEVAALKTEGQATRHQLEQSQRSLADEKTRHTKTHEGLIARNLETTQLAQQVVDLQDRLVSEERHRQSLEEKHQHAREALEHFRTAAKEQREQEQRQHDQQVQYLQSELRKVTDTVKRSKVDTFVLVKLFLLLPHAGAAEESPFKTMTYHLIEVKLLSLSVVPLRRIASDMGWTASPYKR